MPQCLYHACRAKVQASIGLDANLVTGIGVGVRVRPKFERRGYTEPQTLIVVYNRPLDIPIESFGKVFVSVYSDTPPRDAGSRKEEEQLMPHMMVRKNTEVKVTEHNTEGKGRGRWVDLKRKPPISKGVKLEFGMLDTDHLSHWPLSCCPYTLSLSLYSLTGRILSRCPYTVL
jgi:hypothetical protein